MNWHQINSNDQEKIEIFRRWDAPLTCWTDVSFRSHKSSNGCAAAGSKSFVYCRIPDDAVKQHLHIHEWYRRRPSSRYGCANASITDILLSYTRMCAVDEEEKIIKKKKLNMKHTWGVKSLPKLTGSNTSIWQRRWTASCVACELNVYRADSDGGFGALRNMCDRAPSQACRISSNDGVPSNSVMSSNCWTGLCAWNKIRRPSNSPNIHPTDQTSTEAA